MSRRPPRPAAELPGDPARLYFSYSHGHGLEQWDDGDTLECWHVSISYGLSYDDEELDQDEDSDLPAEPASGTKVGDLMLYRMRDLTGRDRWQVADAHSGDLEVIASAVFSPKRGTYAKAFDKAIEMPVGDLLILDRVWLDKAWRGFGLGPMCAAEAIRRLSGGCCAVAAYPGMSEYPCKREEVTEEYRQQAKEKIAALWESIGFSPFRRGVWLLDTALRGPEDLLNARQEELQTLSAAYRAHRGH